MSTLASRVDQAWQVLHGVPDPEVPAVSVIDLGIVREVLEADEAGGGGLDVVLTPTYSGCPATEVIEASVREALEQAGLGPIRTTLRRDPAWTTDWISAEGRDKLRAYGIAPPGPADHGPLEPGTAVLRFVPRAPQALACPRCGSRDTERLSAFGSTACKALWRCRACREPFEHFKPI